MIIRFSVEAVDLLDIFKSYFLFSISPSLPDITWCFCCLEPGSSATRAQSVGWTISSKVGVRLLEFPGFCCVLDQIVQRCFRKHCYFNVLVRVIDYIYCFSRLTCS